MNAATALSIYYKPEASIPFCTPGPIVDRTSQSLEAQRFLPLSAWNNHRTNLRNTNPKPKRKAQHDKDWIYNGSINNKYIWHEIIETNVILKLKEWVSHGGPATYFMTKTWVPEKLDFWRVLKTLKTTSFQSKRIWIRTLWGNALTAGPCTGGDWRSLRPLRCSSRHV